MNNQEFDPQKYLSDGLTKKLIHGLPWPKINIYSESLSTANEDKMILHIDCTMKETDYKRFLSELHPKRLI